MRIKELPEKTLERLIVYLKVLEELNKKNIDFISSEDLAKRCGVNSAQLRKDLSFLGPLGTKGVGYSIKSLRFSLKNFLGRAREWNLILGGITPLGVFLLENKNLQKEGFYFLAAFDVNEENIGKIYNGISVYSLDQLSYILNVIKVDIGVITTDENPYIYLKAFTEQKIKAILNLSKIPLFLEDPDIRIENFCFLIALTKLSYFLKE